MESCISNRPRQEKYKTKEWGMKWKVIFRNEINATSFMKLQGEYSDSKNNIEPLSDSTLDRLVLIACDTKKGRFKKLDGVFSVDSLLEALEIDSQSIHDIERAKSKEDYKPWRDYENKDEIDKAITDLVKDFYRDVNSSARKPDFKLKYGIYTFPDSLLPFYFKRRYPEYVKFVVFKTWNSLEQIRSAKADIHLHNFPSVLALGVHSFFDTGEFQFPFFWPVFSFKGYQVVIKRSSINKFLKSRNSHRNRFSELAMTEKRDFFHETTGIMETASDFEWYVKNYQKTLGCESSKTTIQDSNTREAIKLFIKEETYSYICTNPIQALAFDERQFEKIWPDQFTYENINGIISDKTYVEDHINEIKELLNEGYSHQKAFNRECIDVMGSFDDNDDPQFILRSAINGINFRDEDQFIQNSRDLAREYQRSNNFFETATSALKAFEGIINQNELFEHAYAIAKKQLKMKIGVDSEFNEIDLKKLKEAYTTSFTNDRNLIEI
jgi:hypothetical protein